MTSRTSLGDRMKRYEQVSRNYATPNMPLVVRVDGKSFHTFTRGMEKPFCRKLIHSMVLAAQTTAVEMQGFKFGYVQSDEASFVLTDYEKHETEGWFGYCLPKVISITAAMMSVNFNKYMGSNAVFDARAFNVPREDVLNCLLWRARDWERNSISMLAQAHFSHKQLHKKNMAGMHEMLHERGINWADLEDYEKNGTFLYKSNLGGISTCATIRPSYNELQEMFGHLL